MTDITSIFKTITSGVRLLFSQKVPTNVKWAASLIILIYFLLPLDFLPDFFPLLGWADDLTVMYLVFRYLEKHYGTMTTKNSNVIDVEESDIID